MSVQTEIDRIEQNVANTYAVLSALGAEMPSEQNSDNLAETAGTAKAVLYSAQTLTDEQKAQARENIGADKALDYTAYGLPILKLTGDVSAMTKDNPVTLNYVYGDRSGICTCKWQGSSSLAYPKKNYTIKFDNAFEAVEGWGEQKKYCFKANFIDHSHARNVVSAKLWGQMVKSRSTVPTELADLPNGGAIDGFPCIIELNGEFHGLYTWNIPKDGWMFGMGSGTQEAIVCADAWVDATWFKAEALVDGSDFELEYVTDEENAEWVATSLNTLINAVMNSNGTDLDSTIAQYLDWQSAIDYYIFVVLLRGTDMTGKNYLLATYDGTKWFFSAYDMDSTYGLQWDSSAIQVSTSGVCVNTYAVQHKVMELIKAYKTDALKARYAEIRNAIMSEDNVAVEFLNFVGLIPTPVFDEDVRKWPTIPSTASSNVAQILNWYRMRVGFLDAQVNALVPVDPGDLIDPAQIAPQNTWYKGTTAKSSITKIDVVTSYTETGNEDEVWDADSANNGDIQCFVNGSVLTIASMNGSNTIMLAYNMTNMFGGNDDNIFSNVTEITGTEKFVCDPAGTTMTNACRNMAKLTKPIVIPDGVFNLNSAFMGCTSLTEPPVIPESITDFRYLLSGCTALTYLPEIPPTFAGIMTSAFFDCKAVESVDIVIPEGVTALDYAFYGMTKASGTVEINATNLSAYSGAFANACTDASSTGIVLSGTCPVLAEIAATNAQGKVTVAG